MLDSLPNHLSDRIRMVNDYHEISNDGPVVVWLKSSLRVHENPAIDTGILLAERYQKSLLIYQAIDERYPHASLRHHNMLLDGACDLDSGCKSRGLRYVLHVARENNRQAVVKALASSAACIVTDLFPLPPWTHWVRRMAQSANCPVIEVDCHCVIPMTLFGKSVDRPFKFRDATKKMRKRLVQQTWPNVEATVEPYTGELPFTPVDIDKLVKDTSARINLLRDCQIDPTVMPIWRERGGELASLAKWQKFLDKNLGGYARRRNNAADPEGVSRLSAAFHYGFLSPMKVAREASAIGTKSADKYLDELLIFREHAWHHVVSTDTPYCSSNLPHWALESWNNTADDPRPVVLSDHQIEYARSPNKLWNLCQQSLVKHGELHNNLRMTWGKAIPHWCDDLEQSLERAQKYNDKYALDGRDPSSIAGIQWCHGLFDRAFFPSLPIMGVVRKRDLETHASRLDMAKYADYINRYTSPDDEIFVVCGNSLIECYAARVMYDNGINVVHIAGLHDDSEDLELTFDQSNDLPENVSNRLKSIAEKIQSNRISHISKNLLRGIPTGGIENLQTESNQGESKVHFTLNNRKTSVTRIISENPIDLSDAPHLDANQMFDLQYQLADHDNESTDPLSLLPSALWQLAELLWTLCDDNSATSYPVQMKLI